MSEGNKICSTPLLEEIIKQLDPIIKSGIESTLPFTPTEAPTPNKDIDKCITQTIELLDKQFNQYDPRINYQDLLKNSDASYLVLLPQLENNFNTALISRVKEISLNSFSGFIDDIATTVGWEDATIYFKQASSNNERPLYIPQFQYRTETRNLVNEDVEYVKGWSTNSAYETLLDVKYLLFQLLLSAVAIRDLTKLKENTSIDKSSSALQIATSVINQADSLEQAQVLFTKWKNSNLSNAEYPRGYFSYANWYNILSKSSFSFINDLTSVNFITPIIQKHLLNCINN